VVNNITNTALECEDFDYEGVLQYLNYSWDRVDLNLPNVNYVDIYNITSILENKDWIAKNYTLRNWLRMLIVSKTKPLKGKTQNKVGWHIADLYNPFAMYYEYWDMITWIEAENPYYFCPQEPFIASFSNFCFYLTLAVIITMLAVFTSLIGYYKCKNENELMGHFIILICFLLSFCNMSFFLINVIVLYVRIILNIQTLSTSIYPVLALIKSFLSVLSFLIGVLMFSLDLDEGKIIVEEIIN